MLNQAQLEQDIVLQQKKLRLISYIDSPGMILIGLALFALFGDGYPSSLHPILDNTMFVYGMLGVGVIWGLLCLRYLISESLKLRHLREQLALAKKL